MFTFLTAGGFMSPGEGSNKYEYTGVVDGVLSRGKTPKLKHNTQAKMRNYKNNTRTGTH